MGKGGSSSSSNTTQNTNVNGTNAVSGDNLGVLVSGVNGSTINVTATDHGAVKAASETAKASLEFGRDALKSNEHAVDKALKMGGDSVTKALNFGEESLKGALGITKESLDKMETTSKGAIDAVKSMAAQSNENARTAMSIADRAKAHEQTGNAPEMTKIVYGALGVTVVGLGVLAYRSSR
ncbi:hypothetical protein HRJ45_24190 [Vibrio coralliilyticus]|uniref:hypothetical protein n=1 Tax=Vibrio coralliilyticus TaxID=190893 RepID=UPI00155F82EA|nr:hypothetical protein [Vibrio coralliilyticus]NRF28089.1 hypothetical protein [Vibrio coralliilyticus]NRF82213.1 hypothetical protein [Vibrio coralliilyticus]